MLKKIATAIAENNLLQAGERVLVAVSGGMDSIALLFALQKLGYAVTAAHVNHHLRGEAAERDAAFVEQCCAAWQIPLVRGDFEILELAAGENIEDTARRYRYAFLEQQAAELGGVKIATAHHLRDQAETLLLHLLRGSGLTGLGAMREQRGQVIRPLLQVEKAEIAAFCAAEHLTWVEDASNADMRLTRNRIRGELLPQLASYNPQIEQALARTCELAACDEDYLQQQTAAELTHCLTNNELDGARLSCLHESLQRRVLRLFLEKRGVPSLDAEQTRACLRLQQGKQRALAGGYYLRRGEDTWQVQQGVWREKTLVAQTEIVPLSIGEIALWDDFFVQTERCEWAATGLPEQANVTVVPQTWLPHLTLRTRREGDKIAARGMSGHKKVQDIFIDAKVSRQYRGSLPLLCRSDEVVWVPFHRKSAGLEAFTGQAIKISLFKK